MRVVDWINWLGHDLRHAVRAMRRTPAFTLMAIVTMALGIGINTTIVAATNAVLFKGRPFIERADRVVYLHTDRSASFPDFLDWRAQATSFSGMSAVGGVPDAILNDGRGLRERVPVAFISANTFSLLGVRPLLGRDFNPTDEARNAPPVVLLTHDLWESRYGGDPAILGRVIQVDGASAAIVGVMPPGFGFPDEQVLWMPLVPTPRLRAREARTLLRSAPGDFS
jgi:hypothetical protein